MRNNPISAGIISVIILLAFYCQKPPENKSINDRIDDKSNQEIEKMISYNDFIANLDRIDAGAPKSDVETLLGKPESDSDSIWTYNLTNRKGFPGMPPPPGTTVFPSITIYFDNGLVKNISKSWIDVTGPKPE